MTFNTNFYPTLTQKDHKHNLLEKRISPNLGKSLAHDSWTKVAKLVTFTAILVSKIFFYSPWQPKRSQLGALTTHLSRMLCIQLHTVETMEKHGHFFHKKVLCKGTHIHVGYFMDSVRIWYLPMRSWCIRNRMSQCSEISDTKTTSA